ncbi:unnamed protein product [Nesidiocoris tenuis]|uniref:Secreted protein n=1 Tax=Nesidiocoris tenuis TaxID=355587 RepID=A0A6H5H0G0_9HEMI|nr:unnamed protein product [Nesidiocoris tenuis]
MAVLCVICAPLVSIQVLLVLQNRTDSLSPKHSVGGARFESCRKIKLPSLSRMPKCSLASRRIVKSSSSEPSEKRTKIKSPGAGTLGEQVKLEVTYLLSVGLQSKPLRPKNTRPIHV